MKSGQWPVRNIWKAGGFMANEFLRTKLKMNLFWSVLLYLYMFYNIINVAISLTATPT